MFATITGQIDRLVRFPTGHMLRGVGIKIEKECADFLLGMIVNLDGVCWEVDDATTWRLAPKHR